jgi:hypothetical protein
MTDITLETAKSVLALAVNIIPQIEAKWGCIIEVDDAILQEAAGRALLTIEHVRLKEPNAIKQAGHYAFWIRKLKPLRVVNLEQHVAPQSIVPPARRLYVNEVFAIVAAIGIARAGGYSIAMDPAVLNDLAVSLRYHSFSPNALSAILNAYVTAR